jgi:hypothetical protein
MAAGRIKESWWADGVPRMETHPVWLMRSPRQTAAPPTQMAAGNLHHSRLMKVNEA